VTSVIQSNQANNIQNQISSSGSYLQPSNNNFENQQGRKSPSGSRNNGKNQIVDFSHLANMKAAPANPNANVYGQVFKKSYLWFLNFVI